MSTSEFSSADRPQLIPLVVGRSVRRFQGGSLLVAAVGNVLVTVAALWVGVPAVGLTAVAAVSVCGVVLVVGEWVHVSRRFE